MFLNFLHLWLFNFIFFYTILEFTGQHKMTLLYKCASTNYNKVQYGALSLSNSHAVTHDPQPLLENVVHVGGLHIKETKPLPKDLQSFMDAAPQGVVLVSFGSSLTPSSMSADTKQEFIEAFRELKLPVIWKWDEEIKDLPPNVLLSKWLPQQDILAHPKLKGIN